VSAPNFAFLETLPASVVLPTPPIDTDSPTLTSSAPVDDATNVGVDDDLVLTFNEDIVLGSGNIVISDGTETITIDVENANGQLSIVDNVLTINPTNDLANINSGYNIQIDPTAIEDISGNSYAGISNPTDLNFTTPSAVVFDLNTGLTTNDATQTFDPNETYELYLLWDVGTAPTDIAASELWDTSGLGADDQIILVDAGNNGPAPIGMGFGSTNLNIAFSNFSLIGFGFGNGLVQLSLSTTPPGASTTFLSHAFVFPSGTPMSVPSTGFLTQLPTSVAVPA